MDFSIQDIMESIKEKLSHEEALLIYPMMRTFNKSIIGINSIQRLLDETNPNAYTFIINAKPESVDVTFEIADSNKNTTDIIITQNNDRFSSEKTVSFPTNKLNENETFHSLLNTVRKQYKSITMQTILQDATVPYMRSSVKETKDPYHEKTRFEYTLSAPDREPVRFVMSDTLLDLPPYGGNLQYQEFNAFKKQWETKALYISESLMSTKERVEGNETIVGVPTIYGAKWSITDFITKNTSQRTLEQNFIADQLYSIFKRLEYYQKPLKVYVPLNDRTTILFKDDRLSADGKPTVFSFNIHNPTELKTLNDKLIEVSNRVTPAQEEIVYQIDRNNHRYDSDNPKLKHIKISATLPDTLQGTNTVQVSVTSEDTSKDFFVTRINDDQYRITEPFDPNNLPDSIEVYSVVTRTKNEGYSKTLGNELKRIVVNNRQPRNHIKVTKQRPKSKFQQTTLFDKPDNGPSLD